MSPIAMDVDSDAFEVVSPSTVTRTTLWTSLPFEVRQIILKFVCYPASVGQRNCVSYPKVAQFASVCKEWQDFFEARTFRRLVLNSGSVDDFDAIIKRDDVRLAYIQKLWLRVELSEYDCPKCDEPEDAATQRCNNMIFSKCIQTLLGTLKHWDPARHGAQGVELMLSASSPSDTKHRFARCELQDDYPFHYAEDLDLSGSIVGFHQTNMGDSVSGLLHLSAFPSLSGDHINRVQGTPLCLRPQNGENGRFISQAKSLPAVPMVKSLVMRRQFLRGIHIRTLSWLLGRSFVALEWFRFERTISLEPHWQLYFDRGVRQHLLPSLPKTLRQFSFTQWELPKNELKYLEKGLGAEISPSAQGYLPQEMAKLTQRLENLCPPWQMDTASFLRSIIDLSDSHTKVESSLKRLSLRCSFSTPERSRREFESLIMLAATAALSLPQLEIIELWGICRAKRDSRAYVFQYCYEDGRPRIVWRSSAEAMGAQRRIIAQWSEVAEKQSHSTLAYDVVPFKETSEKIFKSRGTCIYRHLLLKDLVFDPITQKILENEPYDWMFCEDIDAWQQDDTTNSNLAPNSANSNLSFDSFMPDPDLALLQADIAAFDNATAAFLQNHQW